MSIPSNSSSPVSRWQKYLADLGINQKFSLINISIVIGILIVTLSAVQGLINLRFHISDVYERRLAPILRLREAEVSMADAQTYLEKLKQPSLTGSAKDVLIQTIIGYEAQPGAVITEYEGQWVTTLDPDFTTLLVENRDEKLQLDEINTLRDLRTAYKNFISKRQEYRNAVLLGKPTTQLETGTNDALVNVRKLLSQLISINLKYADIAFNAGIQSSSRSLATTIALFILVGSAFFILAYSISTSVSTRLKTIMENAQILVGENYTNESAGDVIGLDEIGSVGKSFTTMSQTLKSTVRDMQARMDERTTDMEATAKLNERRGRQFEAITQVSRAIALIQDLNTLLPRITEVISDQFGYYHVGIFLLDSSREFAVLSAANSDGGQRMLLREHKLRVGQVGIVGYVTGTGSPRIALDTGADPVYFDNPDLPNTRSEMALPLRITGQVIGALDVQSQSAAAFAQEDIEILSTLADQVSIAIQNSRSYIEAQKLLVEAQNAVTGYVQDAWKIFQSARKQHGYKITGTDIVKLDDSLGYENINEAVQSNSTVIQKVDGENINLAIPVHMRGKVIGALSIKIPANQAWQQDQVEIAEAIAGRLSLAMEAATLLQSSQRRANIERLTSEITSKISSSTRFDTIVRTAAQELSKSLGSAEVLIQIEPSAIDMIQE